MAYISFLLVLVVVFVVVLMHYKNIIAPILFSEICIQNVIPCVRSKLEGIRIYGKWILLSLL